MKRLISLLVLVVFFIGCGSDTQEVRINQFPSDDVYLVNDNVVSHNIRIHDNNGNFYHGAYPPSIKDKYLGEGLLTYQLNKIKKFILQNYIADGSNPIKISFKIKNVSKDDKSKILTEFRVYFSKQNGKFITIFDGPADVKVYIVQKNGILGFKVVLNSNGVLFNIVAPYQFTTTETLKQMQKDSLSDWSKIKIKTRTGAYVHYLIMKSPVKVTQFYPNKLTTKDRAVTYITFDQADGYCAKLGGSIASLYVFEHALREGKIISPTKFGATAELIAPFDPADLADVRLRMPGDIVSLKRDECEKKKSKLAKDRCYANTDYSNVLEFDYSSNVYKNVEDTYKAQNLTFRCIKGGE